MKKISTYEEAIRQRVCGRCLERTGHGICGMGLMEECALNQRMPSIVEFAENIVVRSLEDYLAAVRSLQVLFSSFENATTGGPNELDHRTTGILDQYIPEIIEAIDTVNKRKKAVWTENVLL